MISGGFFIAVGLIFYIIVSNDPLSLSNWFPSEIIRGVAILSGVLLCAVGLILIFLPVHLSSDRTYLDGDNFCIIVDEPMKCTGKCKECVIAAEHIRQLNR